jgi:hypothetical protein
MKQHGLIPNSYIHVSESDLYIPRISLPTWLQQNMLTDPGNINVEIGRQKFIILFLWNNEASQFHFWENMNWNQTFILDSHQPFICSVYFAPLFLYTEVRVPSLCSVRAQNPWHVYSMCCWSFNGLYRHYKRTADILCLESRKPFKITDMLLLGQSIPVM